MAICRRRSLNLLAGDAAGQLSSALEAQSIVSKPEFNAGFADFPRGMPRCLRVTSYYSRKS